MSSKVPAEVREAELRWRNAEASYRSLMRDHRTPGLEGDAVPAKFLSAEVMHLLETLDHAAEQCRAEYEEVCSFHGVKPRW